MEKLETETKKNPSGTGSDERAVVTLIRPELAKKEPQRTMPKWETETRERVKVAIRKLSKSLSDLVARDANEADTRMIVVEFLCEGFGFDKFADLTAEYQVKGEFADYGLRIDKQLVAFVEVKRVATKLDVKHLRQVEMYAVNEGVEWAILTNGADWRVYHLTGALPMQIDLAVEVNLLGDDSPQRKASQLYYLTKEAMKKGQLNELWKARRAMSPKSLGQVILSDVVVDAIRRELKRASGHSTDAGEIVSMVKKTILRPECFEK